MPDLQCLQNELCTFVYFQKNKKVLNLCKLFRVLIKRKRLGKKVFLARQYFNSGLYRQIGETAARLVEKIGVFKWKVCVIIPQWSRSLRMHHDQKPLKGSGQEEGEGGGASSQHFLRNEPEKVLRD